MRKQLLMAGLLFSAILGFAMILLTREASTLTAEERVPVFNSLTDAATWPLAPATWYLEEGEVVRVIGCEVTKHYQVYKIMKNNIKGYVLVGKYRLSKPC